MFNSRVWRRRWGSGQRGISLNAFTRGCFTFSGISDRISIKWRTESDQGLAESERRAIDPGANGSGWDWLFVVRKGRSAFWCSMKSRVLVSCSKHTVDLYCTWWQDTNGVNFCDWSSAEGISAKVDNLDLTGSTQVSDVWCRWYFSTRLSLSHRPQYCIYVAHFFPQTRTKVLLKIHRWMNGIIPCFGNFSSYFQPIDEVWFKRLTWLAHKHISSFPSEFACLYRFVWIRNLSCIGTVSVANVPLKTRMVSSEESATTLISLKVRTDRRNEISHNACTICTPRTLTLPCVFKECDWLCAPPTDESSEESRLAES